MANIEALIEMEQARQDYWREIARRMERISVQGFARLIDSLTSDDEAESKATMAELPHTFVQTAVVVVLMELAHRRCQEHVESGSNGSVR